MMDASPVACTHLFSSKCLWNLTFFALILASYCFNFWCNSFTNPEDVFLQVTSNDYSFGSPLNILACERPISTSPCQRQCKIYVLACLKQHLLRDQFLVQKSTFDTVKTVYLISFPAFTQQNERGSNTPTCAHFHLQDIPDLQTIRQTINVFLSVIGLKK